jgi:hypothetical protein
MKINSIVFLLALFVCSSVASATSIRTGSSYGQIQSQTTLSGIGNEYLVPLTPISDTDIDLLLQISSGSSDLNHALTVTLSGSLGGPFESGTSSFGLIDCGSNGTAGGNLGKVCTPVSANLACATALASATPSTNGANTIITLPGACITSGATFYFDESGTGSFAVSVSPAVVTPEPSSFLLFLPGIGPIVFLVRRRLHV